MELGASIFAWATRGGCHGGSYGNADASAGLFSLKPSWEQEDSKVPKRMGLGLPYAFRWILLIGIFGKCGTH